jgi:hypothetical protein
MIIKTYDGDRIAEIVIDPTAKPVSATMRVMTVNGIVAAKITRIQTAKEIPPPRLDQEGGGQSHHKGGRYGQRYRETSRR